MPGSEGLFVVKVLAVWPAVVGRTDELARAQAERFDREADVLTTLSHPHIVQLFKRASTADGSPCFITGYVPGDDLDEHVRRRSAGGTGPGAGGDRVVRLLKMFESLARAVQAAHDEGVLHRDIKPANVRVDRNGQPRLLDFGIASRAGDARLTGPHQTISSPLWSSPEQTRASGSTAAPTSTRSASSCSRCSAAGA